MNLDKDLKNAYMNLDIYRSKIVLIAKCSSKMIKMNT